MAGQIPFVTKFLQFRFGGTVTFQDIQTIKLHNQGVVQILGDNQDTGGSNGAGKSLVFNLFADMILGKLPNGLKTTDVISPHGNFFRELTFRQFDDKYVFREFRQWKGNDEFPKRKDGFEFFKNGEAYGARRIPEARKYIADFFGWSEGEFYSGVFFHQDGVHTLVTGTSAERRKYIEMLFDLGLFDEMSRAIGDELDVHKRFRATLETDRIQFENLKAQRENYGDIKELKQKHDKLERIRKKLRRLWKELDAREKASQQAALDAQNRDTLQEQLRELKVELLQLPSIGDASVSTVRADISAAAPTLARARYEEIQAKKRDKLLDDWELERTNVGELYTHNSNHLDEAKELALDERAAKRELHEMDTLDTGKCPHCRQEITGDHIAQHIADTKMRIEKLQKRLKVLGGIDHLQDLHDVLRELQQIGPGEPEPVWHERVEELETDHATRVEVLSAAEAHEVFGKQIQKAEKQLADLPEPIAVDVSDVDTQRTDLIERRERNAARRSEIEGKLVTVEDLDDDIKKLEPKLTDLKNCEKEIDTLTVLQRAYGPLGLKLTAIRRISQAIAKTLPRYTNLLFNEKIKFTVDADKDTAFDILCQRAGYNQCDVRALSGGERARLVAALIFTINDLCNPAKRSNIIILDEPDKSLDDVGKTALQENLLLELKKRFKTVIFISHANVNSSSVNFDRTWTVTKAKAKSTIS